MVVEGKRDGEVDHIDDLVVVVLYEEEEGRRL
jgi:hypothetical protein